MLTVTGLQLLRLDKVTAYWIRLPGFHSDKLLESELMLKQFTMLSGMDF